MACGDDVFDLQMCPLYVEDGDEESLAATIDVQQLRAKQEILEHMARLRDGFEARSRAAEAAANQRASDAVAAKQTELDAAFRQLQDERSQCRTAQTSLDRMLAAYDAIQHVRQYHMLARRAFCGWLGRRQERQRKRQRASRAARHRDLLRLQGQPLLFWLHWTRVEQRSRAKAALERSLEQERAAVRRDTDARLAAMQARVDAAEAAAIHEAALRRDTEEKLKYAFMRHVATLSLEAQEIVQQQPTAQQQQPVVGALSRDRHAVHGWPTRQHARLAGQPSSQLAFDPGPAANSRWPRADHGGNGGSHDCQPSAWVKPPSGNDARQSCVANGGLTPHIAPASGAPSAPVWQQSEPEPVGRALRVPEPVQHSRGRTHSGGDTRMPGCCRTDTCHMLERWETRSRLPAWRKKCNRT